MKVRCLKVDANPERNSVWLLREKVYDVLGIETAPEGAYYRLLSEEGIPALFEIALFEIVDATIPLNWTVLINGPKFVTLTPKKWAAETFWEDYFNCEPMAQALFKSTMLEMQHDERIARIVT